MNFLSSLKLLKLCYRDWVIYSFNLIFSDSCNYYADDTDAMLNNAIASAFHYKSSLLV